MTDGNGIPINEVMRRVGEHVDRERVPKFRGWMRDSVVAADWTQAYRFARCLLHSVPDDPEALEIKARVERECPSAIPDARLVFEFLDLGGIRKVRATCECGMKNYFSMGKVGQEVHCRDCLKTFILPALNA